MTDALQAWNTLSEYFNTYKPEDELDAGTAANMLIAEPIITNFLKNSLPEDRRGRVLDFGCGTGKYCHALDSIGFEEIIGVDLSDDMISIAKKHAKDTMQFMVGDHTSLQDLGQFDAVVALNVFQFIDDLEGVFDVLSHIIRPMGLLGIVDFNPAYVLACEKEGISLFSDVSEAEFGTTAIMHFQEDVSLPIVVRNKAFFSAIFERTGFTMTLSRFPRFDRDFLHKYQLETPKGVSAFQIIGAQRKEI